MPLTLKSLSTFYAERKGWVNAYLKVFVLDFLGKGAGYFMLPFYLHYMTQSDFGTYTYLIYIITVLSGVFSLGISSATSKLYFDYAEKRGSFLFTSNLILLGFPILAYSLLVISSLDIWFIRTLVSDANFNYASIRFPILAYSLFQILFGQLNVYYQLDGKILKFQVYNLLRILGMNLIVIYLLSKDNNESYVCRIEWELLISCLVFFPLCLSYFRNFKPGINKEMAAKCLTIGLPIAGTSVFAFFYTISDKYFLQSVASMQTLALYNLALFLATPLGMILSTFNLLWLPKFFKEKDLATNFRKTQTIQKYLIVGFVATSIGILFLIHLMTMFNIIPENYRASLKIFPFIVVSTIFDALSQLYNNFQIISERTWATLIITILLGGLMFGLNRLLVPKFGLPATISILIFLSFFRFLVLYLMTCQQVRKLTV